MESMWLMEHGISMVLYGYYNLSCTSSCPHMKIPCYMHHSMQQIMALITNSYMDGWICVLALLGL